MGQKTGFIVPPQAPRRVIQPLVNRFVGCFKDRPPVPIVGVFDLLTTGKVALSDSPWQSVASEIDIVPAPVSIAFCVAMSSCSRGPERDPGRAQRR